MKRCFRQCSSLCLDACVNEEMQQAMPLSLSGSRCQRTNASDNAAVSVWLHVSVKRCSRQYNSLCLVPGVNKEMQQTIKQSLQVAGFNKEMQHAMPVSVLVPGVYAEMCQTMHQFLSG